MDLAKVWKPDAGVNKIEVLQVKPSALKGSVILPPSKSHAMRWLVLASMDKSPTKIVMNEIGEDVDSMVRCLQQMAVKWDGQIITGGKLSRPISVLNCANSGTAFRFLLAQSATCDFPIMLDGDASLRARDSSLLIEALGVECSKGFGKENLPVLIKGPFVKESIEVDVSKSSQFHSALMLMAARTKGFDLSTKGEAVSRSHSGLTWELCRLTGAKTPGQPWEVICPDVIIPPDASMMAFAKLAGLFCENPPDESDSIGHLSESLDLIDSNDLITPLAAFLALNQGGTITGAAHAAHKESNRILRTKGLLEQFSIKSQTTKDGLVIEGGQTPKTPDQIVRCYGDHRIQMTALILATHCGAIIESPQLHKVAWPSYLEQLSKCGLQFQKAIFQP